MPTGSKTTVQHLIAAGLATDESTATHLLSLMRHPFKREIPDAYASAYVQFSADRNALLKLKKATAMHRTPSRANLVDAANQNWIKNMVQPETHFADMVDSELRKITQFAAFKFEDIKSLVQSYARTMKQITKMFKDESKQQTTSDSDDINCEGENEKMTNMVDTNRLTKTEIDELERKFEVALGSLSEEIIHLGSYIRLNYRLLTRLSLLFDELFDRDHTPWFLARLIQEPFCATNVDILFIRLSLIWERSRSLVKFLLGESQGGTNDKWKPPESFVRNTTKYWIRSDMVSRVKASILKHLPYLLFGYSSEDLNFLLDPYDLSNPTVPQTEDISDGQLVTSIYLDSEDAFSYHRRIRRDEGATLVRFRWYGENTGDPMKEIFVERKTHHESWAGDDSAKERFALPQKRIFDFMKGKLDMADYSAHVARRKGVPTTDKKIMNIFHLGQEVHEDIQTHRLQPIVRTSYLRSAFQAADNNQVRFSLDVNLCMVDEFQPNGHPNLPWCRVSEEILGKEQVIRFPYAVLEVKLQTEQPSWVTKMLSDSGAIMVYKFSKFQHGMAFLHREKVEHIGVPHWIPDFEERGWVPGFSVPDSASNDELDLNDDSEYPTNYNSAFLSVVDVGNTYRLSPVRMTGTGRENRRTDKSKTNILDSQEVDFTFGKNFSVLPTFAGQLKEGELLRNDSNDFSYDDNDLIQHVYSGARNVKKIDPKSVFASERTFLHYAHKGVFLMVGAMAVLGFATARSPVSIYLHRMSVVSGSSMALTGLCLIVYAFKVYQRRIQKLERRMTKALDQDRERLDDEYGPRVVFAVVGTAMIALLLMNIWSVESSSASFFRGVQEVVKNI